MCIGNRNITARSRCNLKKKYSIEHHLLCIDAEIKNEYDSHQDKREIHVVLSRFRCRDLQQCIIECLFYYESFFSQMKAVIASHFIPMQSLLTGTPLNNVKYMFIIPIKGVMSY